MCSASAVSPTGIARKCGGPKLSAAKARNSQPLIASALQAAARTRIARKCGGPKPPHAEARSFGKHACSAGFDPSSNSYVRVAARSRLLHVLCKLLPAYGSRDGLRMCRTRRQRRRQPAAAPWRRAASRVGSQQAPPPGCGPKLLSVASPQGPVFRPRFDVASAPLRARRLLAGRQNSPSKSLS